MDGLRDGSVKRRAIEMECFDWVLTKSQIFKVASVDIMFFVTQNVRCHVRCEYMKVGA